MIQFSFTALINHLQTFIFCLTFTLSQINNTKKFFFCAFAYRGHWEAETHEGKQIFFVVERLNIKSVILRVLGEVGKN